MNIEESRHLPIVIEGRAFEPNVDGLWSLNAIHRELCLPESKSPSEWRNAVAEELRTSGNLRSLDGSGTWANEPGAIAYAMWVSTHFYLMVTHAFVAMRNDSILSARVALLAAAKADTMLTKAIPKADLIDTRLTGLGITWGQACKLSGISKPQLAKQYLVHINLFVAKDHPTQYKKVLKPIPKGFSEGYFKPCSMKYGNDDGFRVTAKGLAWLQVQAQKINAAIAERISRQAAEARRKKATCV